jgi:hypothetical protein
MSRIIKKAIATLSWIDPTTGLPEVDAGEPGPMIPAISIPAKKGYRFSHWLQAWIEVDASGGITSGNFSLNSNMYRGPSYLGTESEPVGAIGRKITRTRQAVTFRQVVGCRTMAPEKIGKIAGGILANEPLPLLSALPIALGPIGAIYAGIKGGREAAELHKVFPPIWTELELTINVDGSFSHKLLRHSLFPSVSYYVQGNNRLKTLPEVYFQSKSYNAVPMLDAWYENGWGPVVAGGPGVAATSGNPWSMTKPAFLSGSTVITRPEGY